MIFIVLTKVFIAIFLLWVQQLQIFLFLFSCLVAEASAARRMTDHRLRRFGVDMCCCAIDVWL